MSRYGADNVKQPVLYRLGDGDPTFFNFRFLAIASLSRINDDGLGMADDGVGWYLFFLLFLYSPFSFFLIVDRRRAAPARFRSRLCLLAFFLTHLLALYLSRPFLFIT